MPLGERIGCWRLEQLAKAGEIAVSNLSLVEGLVWPPRHDGIGVLPTPSTREGGSPLVYLGTEYGSGLHLGAVCGPCEFVVES